MRWLQHYDAGVPSTLIPYPQRTLLDYLSDLARDYPDSAALLFKGSTLSYQTLERLSDRFASALVALGVRAGDRVGLLLPNCPQFIIAELGAWKAGAVVAPLNPIYTEAELGSAIGENGIETIVALTRFYRRAIKRLGPDLGKHLRDGARIGLLGAVGQPYLGVLTGLDCGQRHARLEVGIEDEEAGVVLGDAQFALR